MGGGRDFVHPGSPISDGDSSDVVAGAYLETEVPHFHGFERIHYSRAELLQLREAVEIPEDILKIKQEFESEIKAAGEFMTMRSEKARSIPCKAYLIGSCQFGDTCCFSHEGHYQRKCEIGQVELNSSGLPLRPGEIDCPYYKRSGICTLLTSCWYHHPDPTITEQDLFSGNVIVGSPRTHAAGARQLPEMPKTLNEYICFTNPSQAEISFAQSLNSSSFLTDCQASEASGLELCSPATDCQSSVWNGPSNVDYTERHAQPKCINFPESGTSKFGSTCKYGHSMPSASNGYTSQIDGPIPDYIERHDQPDCLYFLKYGTCKFGSTCKFKHSPSLTFNGPSSQADGPIQQARMDYTEWHDQLDCTCFKQFCTYEFGTTSKYQHSMPMDSNSHMSRMYGSMQQQAPIKDYTGGPVQSDCLYFIKYGRCEYGSKCKYKHPESSALNSSSSLADNAILRQAHIDCQERHDQPNCTYFLKFGTCKFGSTCKYQHLTPSGLNTLTYLINAPVQREAQMEGYTGRADQSDCLYFLTYGTCQYGSACKYKHPQSLNPQSLTINGSSSQADGQIQRQVHMDNTERRDQSDCTYFMKFGTCKFGSTCKYPHSMSSGLNGRTSQINASIQCQAHMEHYTERTDQSDCPYFVKYGTCQYGSTCKYRHTRCLALNCPSQGDEPIQRQAHMDYTVMNKQSDCTYFMKFGTCKFGSTCKYQHRNISSGSKSRTSHIDDPIQRQAWMEDYTEKSDQLDCPYFTTYGTCKYGSTCKYKHPRFLALNGRPIQTYGPIQRQTCLDFTERHPSPSEGQMSELDGPIQQQFTERHPSPSEGQRSELDCPIQQQAHMENCKERPGQLDCLYFMKNGTCQFGSTCKYKHSQPSAKYQHSVPLASNGTTTWQANLVRPQVQMDEYPLRPDEPVCSYFVKYGTCKFKTACKFNHPLLNEYPQRPGEPECSHFTKFGTCKFKYACKFHHPTPSTLSGLTAKAEDPIHQEQSEYPLRSEGLEYVNVLKHGTSKCYHSSSTTLDGLILEADGGGHHLGKMEHSKRPGELDCPSTMKFGHCSFGDACKYNHPNDGQPKVSSCIISPNGLPLRPDQPTCMYYGCFGICKFGSQCKFNHPMDSSSSMPVANIASCQGSLEDEPEC